MVRRDGSRALRASARIGRAAARARLGRSWIEVERWRIELATECARRLRRQIFDRHRWIRGSLVDSIHANEGTDAAMQRFAQDASECASTLYFATGAELHTNSPSSESASVPIRSCADARVTRGVYG